MRAYEIQPGEVVDRPSERIIVNLDSLVYLSQHTFALDLGGTAFFSNGHFFSLTKQAFDRISIACKSI
jgi:hypothetical protein